MAIVINGSGTVTGLSVGGLPDGTVDSDTLASGIDKTSISDSGDATAITIDSSENVGIGVTPSAINASYTGINIGKTGTLISETAGNDGLYIGSNAYYSTGNNYKYIMDGKACELKMDASASHFKFRTASSGTAGNAITFTDRLEITDDGRGLSQFTAKAWCNFNGEGTIAFRDSHNCSSLTDHGNGEYTVNFSNNMGNVNYSSTGMSGTGTGGLRAVVQPYESYTPAVGSCRYNTIYQHGSVYDAQQIMITVFGD